jgi:hypothetical protein
MKSPTIVINYKNKVIDANDPQAIKNYLLSDAVKKHHEWCNRLTQLVTTDITEARVSKEISTEEEKYYFELAILCALTETLCQTAINCSQCIDDIHPMGLIQKCAITAWDKKFDPPDSKFDDLNKLIEQLDKIINKRTYK